MGEIRKARGVWEFLTDLVDGRRKTFFLGAGASAGLVPTVGEVIPRLVALADDRRLYVPAQTDLPVFAEQVIEMVRDDPWKEELLRCMSPEAWKTKYDRVLLGRIPRRGVPAQYVFCRLLPGPLAIVTTNTDGLAKRYCPSIPVVELHGSITCIRSDRNVLHLPHDAARRAILLLPEEEEIDLAQEFECRLVEPQIVRPGDPEVIAGWGPWTEGERLLATADVIVFVGYSFPHTDLVVWDLVEAVGRDDKRRTIWVVDPAPDAVVAKVEGLLRTPARGLVCRWDRFWGAVVDVARRRRLRSLQAVGRHADDVAARVDVCVLTSR